MDFTILDASGVTTIPLDRIAKNMAQISEHLFNQNEANIVPPVPPGEASGIHQPTRSHHLLSQPDDALLSASEVAALLGKSEVTLGRWRRNRTGPAFVRLGNRPSYRVAAVKAYLQACERA